MPIRDLGYKPYEGKRLPHRSRYKVLIRRTLALAWGQGLVKATMIVGAFPMVVCAVIIWGKLQAMKVLSARMLQMGAQGAAPLNLDDPVAYVFYCMYWTQLWFAFALGLLVAAPAITGDVRTGAFSFYFARPVDRGHYLLGKVVPAAVLVLIITTVPALLLCLLRLSLGGGEDAALVAPKLLSAAAFAPIYAATMVLPPVALSAMGRKSGNAQGLWAALFFASWLVGEGTAAATEVPYAALISIPTNLRLVGQYLFGMEPSYALPWYLPAGVLVLVVAGAAYLLLRRLNKVEVFA
jgi:hypothetical protein